MIYKAQFQGSETPYLILTRENQEDLDRSIQDEHDSLRDCGWTLVYFSRYDEINNGKRWLWKKGAQTIMSSLKKG